MQSRPLQHRLHFDKDEEATLSAGSTLSSAAGPAIGVWAVGPSSGASVGFCSVAGVGRSGTIVAGLLGIWAVGALGVSIKRGVSVGGPSWDGEAGGRRVAVAGGVSTTGAAGVSMSGLSPQDTKTASDSNAITPMAGNFNTQLLKTNSCLPREDER